MVAASERAEQAGSAQYHEHHMSAIFKEGFSFSGYERNHLFVNQDGKAFVDLSGVSGLDAVGDSRSFAVLDYNRDGWPDIGLVNPREMQRYAFSLNNPMRYVAPDGLAARGVHQPDPKSQAPLPQSESARQVGRQYPKSRN